MSRLSTWPVTRRSCRRSRSGASPGCIQSRLCRSAHPSRRGGRPRAIHCGSRCRSCTHGESASVLLSPTQEYPGQCRLAIRSGRNRGHVAASASLRSRAVEVKWVHHISDVWMLYGARHRNTLRARMRSSGSYSHAAVRVVRRCGLLRRRSRPAGHIDGLTAVLASGSHDQPSAADGDRRECGRQPEQEPDEARD